MKKDPLNALKKVISILGSQTELAKRCGLKQQTIFCWLNKFKQVPAARVLQIEKAVNGEVTRYELRPDIYPLEKD